MNIRLEGTREEIFSVLGSGVRIYPNRRGEGCRAYLNGISPEQLGGVFDGDKQTLCECSTDSRRAGED